MTRPLNSYGRVLGYDEFRGIMHCFGGTPRMAEDLMKIGFLISFAGNVTFKKAENLRDAARSVPLDSFSVETDCPFLTPVPFAANVTSPPTLSAPPCSWRILQGVEIRSSPIKPRKTSSSFYSKTSNYLGWDQ